MEKALYRLNLWVFSGLFVTGLLYLVHSYADEFFFIELTYLPSSLTLMKLHGALTMLFLIVFGITIYTHICIKIRSSVNRSSGIMMLSFVIILILSSYFLYYAGSRELQIIAKYIHSIFGILILAALLLHLKKAA